MRHAIITTALFALMILLSGASGAQEAPADAEKPPARRPSRGPKIVYNVPDRGAPQVRAGGGARAGGKAPAVDLLAPRQAGRTTSAHPVIYYYLPEPTEIDIVITITSHPRLQTIFEHTFKGAKEPGIHPIDLKEHNITLEPGVSYEIIVLVDADPKADSSDPLARGWIQRVDAEKPAETDKLQTAIASAANGLWYDAHAILGDLIRDTPKDPAIRDVRADLLEQEQLTGPAEFERKMADALASNASTEDPPSRP